MRKVTITKSIMDITFGHQKGDKVNVVAVLKNVKGYDGDTYLVYTDSGLRLLSPQYLDGMATNVTTLDFKPYFDELALEEKARENSFYKYLNLLIEAGYTNIGVIGDKYDVEVLKEQLRDARINFIYRQVTGKFLITHLTNTVEVFFYHPETAASRLRGPNHEAMLHRKEVDEQIKSLTRLVTRIGKNPLTIEI
jgi:hypothetical protein